MTDMQLLKTFVESRSEEAFRELVRRHIDWVYSAARRMVVDGALAEDVTQAVFILVAQKAGKLAGHGQFTAWLFQATRFCASNALKKQANRRRHEKEAGVMRSEADADEAVWAAVAPQLEGAMARLGAQDRDALLLRFYQGKKVGEVAESLGVGEEAAKKRIQRAVEKLRGMLGVRGETGETTLTALLGAYVTQQAPGSLLAKAAVLSGKSAGAAALAQAAGKAMAWAQWKFAACVIAGAGVAGGVGYEAITHAGLTRGSIPVAAPVESRPADLAAAVPVVAAADFDGLYEKAPGSMGGLTMQAGPNTFAVTAVLRYGADGKAVASDGLGKGIDPASIPLGKVVPPAGAGVTRDVLLVQLSPGPERFDIDRLRIFDHVRRRNIEHVLVTQVPGTSVLQVTAMPGTLPAQVDLWLAVASYDGVSAAVALPAVKSATAVVGGATVGFADLRDGAWNYGGNKFTALNEGTPGEKTSLQLQARGPWKAGRYQVAAVTKEHQKYLSDFFVDFRFDAHPVLFFPMGLERFDHLELRPSGHQRPFYFDGVTVPPVKVAAAGISVAAPVVQVAKTARVALPSGGTVELAGIGRYPSTDGVWWGIDGKPVHAPPSKSGGSISVSDKEYRMRELFARVRGVSRERADIQWGMDGGGGWAGGSENNTSHVSAALPHEGPVTIRLGVPATGWQMLEEIPVGHLPGEFQAWPGLVGSLEQRGDEVRLTTNGILTSQSARIVLVDHDGGVHTINGWEGTSEDKMAPWGSGNARLSFRKLRVEDVEAVRIETRAMEYAEFRDVPMEPR